MEEGRKLLLFIEKKTSDLANSLNSLGEDFVPETEKRTMLSMACGHQWLNLR
jgi:hypothetical protein